MAVHPRSSSQVTLGLKRACDPRTPGLVDLLAKYALEGRVTLVFSARDESHNDAVALAAVVRRRMAAILRGRRRAAQSH